MNPSKNYFFYLLFFFMIVQVADLTALQRRLPLEVENARLRARIRELEAKLRGTKIPALEAQIVSLRQQITQLKARPGVPAVGAPGVGTAFFEKHAKLISDIEDIEQKLEQEKQDSRRTSEQLFTLMKTINESARTNMKLRQEMLVIKQTK